MNIKNLYEMGVSIKKISSILNISPAQIKQYIKENNLCILNRAFSTNEKDYIINAYKTGVSIKQLGKIYKIDKRRIEKLLKNNNVEIRTLNESHRVFNFNEHVFDSIDTKEKAYWLGFLYADGTHNKHTTAIALKASDAPHLEKFCEFLDLTKNNIKFYNSNIVNNTNVISEKKYPSVNIRACSQYMCSQLDKQGCFQNKTFKLRFPNLREDLISHFVRGYSDGDGSLKMNVKTKEWRWSVVSTGEFIDVLKEKISFVNSYKTYISKTNNNTYALTISGNMQLHRFCDWMYQDSNENIRLDRKYERYLKLVEQQCAKNARNANKKKKSQTSETTPVEKII